MATNRNTPKNFERRTAKDLSTILGVECKRTPLSGTNSGHGPGDNIIPEGFDLLVEDKLRAKFEHHRLFREAQKQAEKFGIKNIFLCTQKKYEKGYLVTIDRELFIKIFSLPEVRKLLCR